MGVPLVPPAGAGADIFLHVQAKRAGKVKGESKSPGFADDIELLGWHWGVSAASGLDHTKAVRRRSYTALTVHKRIDSATTALMSALVTNDEIKEAKLTMRRAGGDQEPFFVIKLERARVTSVQHDADASGDARETVAFAFTKVEVEYTPQRATGLRSGGMVFTDELLEAS